MKWANPHENDKGGSHIPFSPVADNKLSCMKMPPQTNEPNEFLGAIEVPYQQQHSLKFHRVDKVGSHEVRHDAKHFSPHTANNQSIIILR